MESKRDMDTGIAALANLIFSRFELDQKAVNPEKWIHENYETIQDAAAALYCMTHREA